MELTDGNAACPRRRSGPRASTHLTPSEVLLFSLREINLSRTLAASTADFLLVEGTSQSFRHSQSQTVRLLTGVDEEIGQCRVGLALTGSTSPGPPEGGAAQHQTVPTLLPTVIQRAVRRD